MARWTGNTRKMEQNNPSRSTIVDAMNHYFSRPLYSCLTDHTHAFHTHALRVGQFGIHLELIC